MSSFLDQSQLIDLAERLVSAARRAGADAADAVAVRSISLSVDVRDGAVEESARAEGDDMGCVCWLANVRPWSRPTTRKGTAPMRSPSALSRWRVLRRRTNLPGLQTRNCW